MTLYAIFRNSGENAEKPRITLGGLNLSNLIYLTFATIKKVLLVPGTWTTLTPAMHLK